MRARFSRREGFVVEGGGLGGLMGGLTLEDLASPGSSSQNDLGDGLSAKHCNLLFHIGTNFPNRRKQLTKDIRIMLAHLCEKSLAWNDFLGSLPIWLHESIFQDLRVLVIRPGETRKIRLPPDLLITMHGDFEIILKTPEHIDNYRLKPDEFGDTTNHFWNPTDQYQEYFSHLGRKPSNYKLSHFLGIEDPIEVNPSSFQFFPQDPFKPTEASIDEITIPKHTESLKPKGLLTRTGRSSSSKQRNPQPSPHFSPPATPPPDSHTPDAHPHIQILPVEHRADLKHWLESTFDIGRLISSGSKLYLRLEDTNTQQKDSKAPQTEAKAPQTAQTTQKQQQQPQNNGYLLELPAFLANRFYCRPHRDATVRLIGLLREAPLLSTVPIDTLCFLSQLTCIMRSIAAHEKILWRPGSGPKRIGFLRKGSVLVTLTYPHDAKSLDSESKSTDKDQKKPEGYMKSVGLDDSSTRISYIVSAPSSFFGYSQSLDRTCSILSLSARSEWSEFFSADVERVCPSVIRTARKQEKLRISRQKQANITNKHKKSDSKNALEPSNSLLVLEHAATTENPHGEAPVEPKAKLVPAILEMSGHQGIVSLEEKFASVKENSPEMQQFYEFITPGVVSSKPEVSEDKPVTIGWGQVYDPVYFGNYEESYRIMPSVCSRVPPLVVKNNNIGKEAKVNFLYNVNLCLPRYVDGKKDCWLPKYLPLKPHNDYLKERMMKRKSSPRSPLHSASQFLEDSTLLELDPVWHSEASSYLGSISDAGSEGKSSRIEQNRLINISKLNLNHNALKIRKGCSIKRELHPSQKELKQDPPFETAREQARKHLKQHGPLKSIHDAFRAPQVQSTLASERNSTASQIISERSPIGSGIFGSESQQRSLLSPIRVQPLRRKLSKSQDLTDMHSYSINSEAYDSLSLSRQEMSNRLMEIKRLNKSRMQELPFLHAQTKGNSKSRVLLRESKQKLSEKPQKLNLQENSPALGK